MKERFFRYIKIVFEYIVQLLIKTAAWFKARPKLRSVLLKTIIGLLVATWIVFYLISRFFTFPAPLVQAVFYQVESSKITKNIQTLGHLMSPESVSVTSRFNGVVESLDFTEGSLVNEGDLLATLRQGQEQAQYQSIKARWENAVLELRRQKSLHSQQLISKSSLDTAIALETQLRNDKKSAEARLNDQIITAPFTGLIGLRKVSIGSYVNAGQVITTLDSVKNLFVDFALPAIYLDDLKVGKKVVATFDFNSNTSNSYDGEVFAIDSRVEEDTQSISLRANVSNQDRLLRPGLLMRLQLIVDSYQGIEVPEEAVLQRQDKAYLWIAKGEYLPEESSFFGGFDSSPKLQRIVLRKIEVVIGIRRYGWVEVTGAELTPGTMVLIRGLTKLKSPMPTVGVKEILSRKQLLEKK